MCFLVEGDTGGPVSNPDAYQDTLSKKQRRPQEDERRRKEQGAAVSETYAQSMCSVIMPTMNRKSVD